jgi:hypothetical protein
VTFIKCDQKQDIALKSNALLNKNFMTGSVIKILIGLFVWMVLPRLIYNKRKYKKNTPQFFSVIACKIVGILIIVYAIIGLIHYLVDFE